MALRPSLPAVHPALGALKHDEARRIYEGILTVGDRKIAFRLESDKAGDFANAEKAAARFAAASESDCRAVAEFLAERYLDRLNDEWKLPGNKPVSYRRFIKLTRPTSVTFRGDGVAEFIGGARLLEGGHCLIARARHDGQLFDAGLAG